MSTATRRSPLQRSGHHRRRGTRRAGPTADEALAAIEAINGDYRGHCLAARRIAEEYFEARGVAARLLTDVGLA